MVRDTGPGMDPATRSRIFEPFFTTKPVGKGTGLGLAVVHGIVQGHGASIAVHSDPGEGAGFFIYFPAAPAVPAQQARAEPRVAQEPGGAALAPRAKGMSILYVDDDEAIVFMMTRFLERQGYRVSGYTDPREALAAVRSQPDAFDLVVTDYNMPRLSGLDVARALREIRTGLPVALASGYITEELRALVSAAGVRELIYKPDTADALCEAVTRLASTLSR
jgi:CheY-like chemotaxis protein